MSSAKPEFHLRRVFADGSSDRVEIHPVRSLPSDTKLSRRGMLGAGLALGTILSMTDREETAAGAIFATSTHVQIHAHTSSIKALTLSADGKLLVSGAADKTVKLWELPDGKHIGTLKNDNLNVSALLLFSDMARLAVGAGDKTVMLWNLGEANVSQSLPGHKRTIVSLAQSAGGAQLVSASYDRINFWSPPQGSPLRTVSIDEKFLKALVLAPDGTLVAFASGDGTIKLWSLPAAKLLKTLAGHARPVGVLAVSADCKLLVSGSSDGVVNIWSLPGGRLLKSIPTAEKVLRTVAISPDNTTLAVGTWGHTVKLWSVQTADLLQTLTGHTNSVSAIAFTSDGKGLVSGDSGGVMILWDLATGSKLGYLFDPEASRGDGVIYTVNKSGRTVTYTLPCGTPVPAGAVCVCNCVPGTFKPVPIAARPPGKRLARVDKPRTRKSKPARSEPFPAPSVQGGGRPDSGYVPGGPSSYGGYMPSAPQWPYGWYYSPGWTYCSCNKICTCIPVCQAHRLLHSDPLVRTLAEELLLVMGRRQFPYMAWAGRRATPVLRSRINRVMNDIRRGALPNPARWPTVDECGPFLLNHDEVIAIMAAQMMKLQSIRLGSPLTPSMSIIIEGLWRRAAERPWFARELKNDTEEPRA